MRRVPEPELMEDEAQVRAYAEADFDEPHGRFMSVFKETVHGRTIEGHVLDIGAGPGDITRRFARAYPACTVDGVDGSEAMLRHGRRLLAQAPDLEGRVRLILGRLPAVDLPRDRYDVIISNSLLHHLANPLVLWDAIRRFAAPGAPVCVMDLTRPASAHEAGRLVDRHAAGEPAILRRDFLHSLLAAYLPEEVRDQLRRAGLGHLDVREVGDRHVVVSGFMSST